MLALNASSRRRAASSDQGRASVSDSSDGRERCGDGGLPSARAEARDVQGRAGHNAGKHGWAGLGNFLRRWVDRQMPRGRTRPDADNGTNTQSTAPGVRVSVRLDAWHRVISTGSPNQRTGFFLSAEYAHEADGRHTRHRGRHRAPTGR